MTYRLFQHFEKREEKERVEEMYHSFHIILSSAIILTLMFIFQSNLNFINIFSYINFNFIY